MIWVHCSPRRTTTTACEEEGVAKGTYFAVVAVDFFVVVYCVAFLDIRKGCWLRSKEEEK